ncbi:MAG: hypothetical protein Q8P67_05660 [archaeon]|nr:hypothetical protein [archaeon]
MLTLGRSEDKGHSVVSILSVEQIPDGLPDGVWLSFPLAANGVDVSVLTDGVKVVSRITHVCPANASDASLGLGQPVQVRLAGGPAEAISGVLRGCSERELVIAQGDSLLVLSRAHVLSLSCSSDPNQRGAPAAPGVHVFLALSLPSPRPTALLVESTYTVPSSLLGWSPSYEARLADSRAVLRAVFFVDNQLPVTFASAKVVFSDIARPSPAGQSSDLSQAQSSLNSFSKASKLRLSKNRSPRAQPSHDRYPPLEYFVLDGQPITVRAEQSMELVYHEQAAPIDPASFWFLFDLASPGPSPVPGQILTAEHLGSGSQSVHAAPFVYDLPNNTPGLDLPSGSLSTYSSCPEALASYFLAPPLGHFSLEGTLAASTSGHPVLVPLSCPVPDVLFCGRTRTAFRTTPRSVVETFSITVENRTSIVPVSLLVWDCAFRHTDWFIIRSSHDWQRHGTNHFSFRIQAVPFHAKVEVTYTIEYNLIAAFPPADPEASDPSTGAPPPHFHAHSSNSMSKTKGGSVFSSLWSK